MVKIFSIVSSLIFIHFGYFVAKILIKLDLTKKITIKLDSENITTITPMYFLLLHGLQLSGVFCFCHSSCLGRVHK